ncbi:hypothetical protein DYH09_12535 [bacterium CPR1]|nr:hypothetical protein [bacterium CPR1]
MGWQDVLGFGGVLLLVVGLAVVVARSETGRRRAVHEAATSLGLQKVAPHRYHGRIDGVEVRLGAGWKSASEGVYLPDVAVEAVYSRPFEFEFTLRQVGFLPLRDTEALSDPAFNQACTIESRAPELTLAALTSVELRRQIAELVQAKKPDGHAWVAVVTGQAVSVSIFDAHTRGARSVIAAAERAVKIAALFDQREASDSNQIR